jgi:AcrR family transcriptional regulator
MAPATETRLSAAERRESILEAAMVEFATAGYEGTSTEAIAKRAGISQPYLFRLFGTKKELFKATTERCLRQTLDLMQTAAAGLHGAEARAAIGTAYMARLHDSIFLRAQLQSYAACDDPEIREVVKRGFGELVSYVERISDDADSGEVARFFSVGMLLNVLAAMKVLETPAEEWAQLLLEGCGKNIG